MLIPLLIAAGLAFVAAFALRATKPDKASLAWGAFALGVVLAAAAVIAPRVGGSDVTIAIVAPEEGATVAAGKPVPVEVDVTGAEVAASPTDLTAGHVHLYVDGELALMASGTTGMVRLEPGTSEITAEYVDEQHLQLDPPIRATVEVTAEREGKG